jgi:hypothetical protein
MKKWFENNNVEIAIVMVIAVWYSIWVWLDEATK